MNDESSMEKEFPAEDSWFRSWHQEGMAPPLVENVVLEDAAQGCSIRGRPAVTDYLVQLLQDTFSKPRCDVYATTVQQDSVTIHFILRGRQQQALWGIPATNRPVTLPITLTYQPAGRPIETIRLDYNARALLKQLGLAL